jgi:hypothetical protein
MYCGAVSYDVVLVIHYWLFVEILFNFCNIFKRFIRENTSKVYKQTVAENCLFVSCCYSSAKCRH